mmetsp:Transcript_37431/g.91738  ORF Transcript_37431/g.91738 Transcript_37431/m.91738 type:complete len:178 (+) Transcript_37431:79-612(+)
MLLVAAAMVAVVVVATTAAADASPCSFSSFHAHCRLDSVFKNGTCAQVEAFFTKQFSSCCASHVNPDYTNWKLDSSSATKLTGHITLPSGYVDDQEVYLSAADGGGCHATVCSQSRSLSYYDYKYNAIEAFNLANANGRFQQTFSVSDATCKFHPTLPAGGAEWRACAADQHACRST